MTTIKMDIVNVNWGADGITILLEDRNRKDEKLGEDPKPFTAAEVMGLVAQVEKFFAAEFVVDHVVSGAPDDVIYAEGKPTHIPNTTKALPSKPRGKNKDAPAQEAPAAPVDEKQLEIPVTLSEETTKLVEDVRAKVYEAVTSINKDVSPARPEEITSSPSDLRAMAARESQPPVDREPGERVAAPREPTPATKEPVKDTGQPLDQLAREIQAEEDPSLAAENEMALDVFTDQVNAITDHDSALDAAVNVWTENKELFAKYPLIRDRARLILAGHVGKVLGITASAASDMIKERLIANARPIVQPAKAANSAGNAFIERLAKDPKPVMGTAIKFACEAVANPQKEVTAKLVEDFLVDLVGKHPVLTSAQEIRDLVSSSRFKLFAAAAKTKVVDPT